MKNFVKFLKVFTFLCFILIFSTKVNAAVITPDKYYLQIEPEANTINKITVFSTPTALESKNYYVYAVGMQKIGEQNERNFYLPDKDNIFDIANYIKIKNDYITVNPSESVDVFWEINLPKNIFSCKSYYAAIAVSETNDTVNNNQTNINIENRVISQIHLNIKDQNDINCNFKSNLILNEFKLTSIIPIFNYHDFEFKTTIENNSEILSKSPKGFIEIFGIGEKITIPFNEEGVDIYSNTMRTFFNKYTDVNYPKDNIIDQIIYEFKNFRFGIYTARLGITKNVNNQIISEVKLFIFPYRVVIILLLVIIGLLLIIYNNIKLKKEIRKLK